MRLPHAPRFLALLCAAATAAPLLAQASIELRARGREAFVGEAFELTLEIADFNTAEDPVVPDVPGATLRQAGGLTETSQLYSINGRTVKRATRRYAFEVTPHAPGELAIPPFAVTVDGRRLATQPLTVKVLPSDISELLRVTVTTGRQRIYVGQRVPVTLTIWLKPARYGNQLLQANQMLRLIRPIDFGPFPLQVAGLSVGPPPGAATGENFYAFQFATTIVPEQPGPLRFPDIAVGVEYPTASGVRNLRATAEVEDTTVLPIPTAGRPPNYNGAVGLFDIQASAQPTRVSVGDPIELTIDIMGAGALESLPPPLLAANPGLAQNFRLPSEALSGELVEGRRRFRLTIRPQHAGISEIPPIEYPYFDPDAERFITPRSAPIPLQVSAAAEIGVPALPLPEPSTPGPGLQALDGLRDIETRETELLSNSLSVAPAAVWVLLLAPPALFALSWVGLALSQSRTADPARRRRRTALRTARRTLAAVRNLPPADQSRAVQAALAGYLADRLDLPPGRFTGAAAAEFLATRGASPAVRQAWLALAHCCDEAGFAGGAATGTTDLPGQALACLQALEREKLS